jgi:hypothetical protein
MRPEVMLTNLSRTKLIETWVGAILVIMACSVVAGVDLTLGAVPLWFVAAVVPPGVLLILWRGAPPQTAAALIYGVDTASKDAGR